MAATRAVCVVFVSLCGCRTARHPPREFSRHQVFLREAFRFYRTEFLTSQVKPIVRGDDLIEAFGVTPGPFLGFALDCLREAQATGLINSREEALAYVQEHLDSWQRSFEELPS